MSFQAGASPTPVAPGFGGTRLATGPKLDANRRWSSSLRLWPRNSSTVCSCQASLIWRSVSASSGRQRSTPPISAPITGCSLVTEIVLIRSAAIATFLSRRQRLLRAIYQAGRRHTVGPSGVSDREGSTISVRQGLLRCGISIQPMSARGQTRSFADVRAMSALPPEAVVERASMDGRFVPLAAVSKCSKMHVADLLNHLAGAGKHRGRHVEAERLGGLQVDHKVGACTGRSSVHIPMVSSTHFSTGAVLAASATHFFIWLALAAPRSFLSVASFSHAA